ncbi:thiamine pyrophosphate-binding protein [Pendulispora albinea]|uniref:Thiamine pyrophosphate-binding protein n=1 Tax=Pendulispora albinea TaxID=2741071 RepID=A0ABZ2M1Z1_9BACT
MTRIVSAIARALSMHSDRAFGVVGSGNFHLVNALRAAGMDFVAARHEGGAATMADAYARIGRRGGVLTVHQGPGLTNALTGIAEAAKSRTPLLVLVPEVSSPRSNFHLDLPALAKGIGAGFVRARGAADIPAPRELSAQGTVMVALPVDVLAADSGEANERETPSVVVSEPGGEERFPLSDAEPLLERIASARRPVFIAGHGAVMSGAGPALAELAERCGALLAVSARAKGLFVGNPWYLDVSGGFASPLAAELIRGADLVVAWGASLTMWTTRHGRIFDPDATVAQVALHPGDLGSHTRVDCGVVGDARKVAECIGAALVQRGFTSKGYRSDALRERIASAVRWRDVPYEDDSDGERLDPRTLTIALDDMLPEARTVAVDSGNFVGYPAMYLRVPDERAFCFTQAFQSIGLGLPTAIGAALARPDRLTVAAVGDGGFLMSIAELETVTRLGLPMLIVVYDDAAYGAEVHHFAPGGHPLDTVQFPDRDLAAMARGFGCEALTVRTRADLEPLLSWLASPRESALLIDAKVTSKRGAWWLEEAFVGH